MKLLNKYLPNVLFALHVLLVFLLLFESRVVVPIWLQPLGRMHPLMLHFPLALLVVLGILQLFRGEFAESGFEKLYRFLLQITALCTVLAALMGLFLSLEEGYTGEVLAWHKWGGVIISFLAYAWLSADTYIQQHAWARMGLIPLLMLGVLATGHLGSSLTHGADFLWEPLMDDTEPTFTRGNTAFEVAIAPILEQKCQGCHNPNKLKGELDMSSLAGLKKGGKHGPIWEARDPENSPLIQRAILPLEHEEHMPPEGKAQLTQEEFTLLQAWIASGADLNKPIDTYPEGDSFIAQVLPILGQATESNKSGYDFEFASLQTVEQLNTAFRSISLESPNSPALHAQLFVRQAYKPESLTDLLALKEQLTQLNLTNMPIQDEDMDILAQFTHLEKLILNGTDITGKDLRKLAVCANLSSLSLSNTKVDGQIYPALEKMGALKELFIWNTSIDSLEVSQWENELPQLDIHLGFIPDEKEILDLSPPQMLTKARILTADERIELKHNFPGVEIRYTLDGSVPDSTDSPLYKEPIPLNALTQFTTKAFRPGWRSSTAETYTFFVKGATPKEVELLALPHQQYPGQGSVSLTDAKKGDPNNFRRGEWLGYKEKPFEALIDFGDSIPSLKFLTLSYLKNIGSYIMPPKQVKVWGGNDPKDMDLLVSHRPKQPTDYEKNLVVGLELDLPDTNFRYYRIEATPVFPLPKWHRGAGDKAWVFVDELMFN